MRKKMSRFYTDCDECNDCVAHCSLGNISCPCEHGSCPNDEELDNQIKTLGELATQFCCVTECKNCPVVIYDFEKRTEYEKTCLHEPCVSNLYKWILEQAKKL